MNKRAGISSFSILLIMSVLAIAGLAAANVLKVQYSPSIPQNSITVFFSYPGASAYTVEAEVTSRLEGLMSNVTSVSAISSVSYEGSGNVSILFNKHVDMAAARFEVASYIRNIYPKLPAGVTYPNLSLNVSGKTSSIALSYDIKSNLSMNIPQFIAVSKKR